MISSENFFDFLLKGQVNLLEVRSYLGHIGYEIESLRQPGRHVVGLVRPKENQKLSYFFKMASRPGLSVFIKNEYSWSKAAQDRHRTNRWPLSIPYVYRLGKMDRLFWLITEYVHGVTLSSNITNIESAFRPIVNTLVDIIRWKTDFQLPLDKTWRYTTIQQRAIKRVEAYMEQIDRARLDPRTVYFLDRNMNLLESAPSRGDVGVGNLRQGRDGQLWLVDSEFASFKNFKFYDIAYCYFRIYVNERRADLAQKFMDQFRQTYQLTARDEKILRWVILYRLLGGYREARKQPFLYPAIDELQELVLNGDI